MAFAAGHESRFPMVHADLGDVTGTPGLPPPPELARSLSGRRGEWRAVDGGPGLFLISSSPGPQALGAFEARVAQPGDRVLDSFRSSVCTQRLHQQVLRGSPVVGARFREVSSPAGAAVVGSPVGGLGERDPGPAPRRRRADVAAAVRERTGLGEETAVELERVVFPVDGSAVWAYRAKATSATLDVRAYVRADDLSLLYAQDVSCAASFGEGRAFPRNPGDGAAAEVVRLSGLADAGGALASGQMIVQPARGTALRQAQGDFRVDPAESAFDEVSAFHHVSAAARYFEALLGPDLFAGEPFVPLRVVVRDRTVRSSVGVFFPGRNAIALADGERPAGRSGDICVHEFAHAVVHRVARLDDEFASAVARGLNEGFGDYAQATLYGDPRFGDWVRDQPEGARRCDDATLRLPPKPVDPADRYVVGAAWAALLWDLRTALGPGVADAVAFHALHFLGPSCTYEIAREALHRADASLFPAKGSGRHRTVIDDAFARRSS
jgi:hypothetical protein